MRTAVTVGCGGTDENPNPTGGTSGSSAPHATPPHVTSAATTRCWPVAPYHSRRPAPALPTVRTPGTRSGATGPTTVANARERATARGSAARSTPTGVRPPSVRYADSGPAVTCQRRATASHVTRTGVDTTSSNAYVAATSAPMSADGTSSVR